jgi:hypothetical protein
MKNKFNVSNHVYMKHPLRAVLSWLGVKVKEGDRGKKKKHFTHAPSCPPFCLCFILCSQFNIAVIVLRYFTINRTSGFNFNQRC